MAVTESSRQAYFQAIIDGKVETQKEHIMAFMFSVRRPVTRQEISKHTGIPLHLVSARITGLFGKNKSDPDYVRVHGKGTCPITGSENVEFLVPVGTKFQTRRMF